MAHGIQDLSTSTFDEAVKAADTAVVVDFWAEWCGPCKMITPILEELASEQAGKITVAKLNVDENPDLAMRYNVMSIPTLLVFKDGEVAKRLVGAKPQERTAPGAERIPPGARLSAQLPLGRGDRGDAVRDLQRRLTAAGFGPARAQWGYYCDETRASVAAFQQRSRPARRTACATTSRGTRSSRPAGCSATGRSTCVAPTSGVTTWPSSSAGSAASASTRGGWTGSSVPTPPTR